MENKKQHFVPDSYLKAWCDPDTPSNRTPHVWVFGRNERSGKPKAPRKIFWEADFYTLPGASCQRDLTLEKSLGRLENDFVNVRRKKLDQRQQITQQERLVICAFCAAMHVRTRAQRDYFVAQWRDILGFVNDITKRNESASEEAPNSLGISIMPDGEANALSFSLEDIRHIVRYPAQSLLPIGIKVETPILARMNMAILCTDDHVGFITSDHPCLWFDPASPNQPPGLDSRTTEVILPLSPSQLLLLSWCGPSAYIDMTQSTVTQANWRQWSECDRQYVVRRNQAIPFWLFQEQQRITEAPNTADRANG